MNRIKQIISLLLSLCLLAALAACGAQPYIETVWGCGYKWKR